MKLPALTHTVLLDRHMASVVHAYLAAEQKAVLMRNPSRGLRMSSAEALSMAPLTKLLTDLHRLVLRDQGPAPKKPRPHKLKVAYPEQTTLRLYYARMLARASCHPDSRDYLATALGRFHVASLQLESHIELADPRQLALF